MTIRLIHKRIADHRRAHCHRARGIRGPFSEGPIACDVDIFSQRVGKLGRRACDVDIFSQRVGKLGRRAFFSYQDNIKSFSNGRFEHAEHLNIAFVIFGKRGQVAQSEHSFEGLAHGIVGVLDKGKAVAKLPTANTHEEFAEQLVGTRDIDKRDIGKVEGRNGIVIGCLHKCHKLME